MCQLDCKAMAGCVLDHLIPVVCLFPHSVTLVTSLVSMELSFKKTEYQFVQSTWMVSMT